MPGEKKITIDNIQSLGCMQVNHSEYINKLDSKPVGLPLSSLTSFLHMS